MSEWKPRISRRDFFKWSRDHALELSATAVASGTTAALLLYETKRSNVSEPKPNSLPDKLPENLQPFVPSVEIGKQTDAETFKMIVEELFTFSNEVDAGHMRAVGKIPQTDRWAWARSIPFQKEDQDQNLLEFRWGFRTTAQLGIFIPDLTAREITIGKFKYELGIPFTSLKEILINPKEFIENLKNSRVINFNAGEIPRQFWPAPPDPEKKSPLIIVKPIELSPNQLAFSLEEIVDCFNSRLAIQKRTPQIDPNKSV